MRCTLFGKAGMPSTAAVSFWVSSGLIGKKTPSPHCVSRFAQPTTV
jgi:hypothetical protein